MSFGSNSYNVVGRKSCSVTNICVCHSVMVWAGQVHSFASIPSWRASRQKPTADIFQSVKSSRLQRAGLVRTLVRTIYHHHQLLFVAMHFLLCHRMSLFSAMRWLLTTTMTCPFTATSNMLSKSDFDTFNTIAKHAHTVCLLYIVQTVSIYCLK